MTYGPSDEQREWNARYQADRQDAYEARMERLRAAGWPIRENMIVDQDCYSCRGTGYTIWAGRSGSECLHHSDQCEPGTQCHPPCEFADLDEWEQCLDCGGWIDAGTEPQTCSSCRRAASIAALAGRSTP